MSRPISTTSAGPGRRDIRCFPGRRGADRGFGDGTIAADGELEILTKLGATPIQGVADVGASVSIGTDGGQLVRLDRQGRETVLAAVEDAWVEQIAVHATAFVGLMGS